MSGSFITNLVKRGSGLAFSAIRPNSMPYFPPMPASPGQGHRSPFARVFSGILPRISDLRGWPDSMNTGDLAKKDVMAGRSVESEFERMRNTDRAEASVTQDGLIKSRADMGEEVQSTPFREPSRNEASLQSQPDYETPDVTPTSEVSVTTTVESDKKLPEAAASPDLQNLRGISMEVRPDLEMQATLPSKAELAREAPSDSLSTGPQIDQKEIITDLIGRDLNIASVTSIPRISGDAYSIAERDADLSEIKATTSPGPEPKSTSFTPAEIKPAVLPGLETKSISLTPKEIMTEILPGSEQKSISSAPKETITMVLSGSDQKSTSFTPAEIKPAVLPGLETKSISLTPKEITTEIPPGSGQKSISSAPKKTITMVLPGSDQKSTSFTPAEIQPTVLPGLEKKSISLTPKEIMTEMLPGSGQKSTSSAFAVINAAASPGRVPELLPSRQGAIGIAGSKETASILNPPLAFERSNAASPIQQPRYAPERSFIPKAQPEVHISIGTIEVRADTKPDAQSAELPPENPGPFGFDEYAQIRRYISWER